LIALHTYRWLAVPSMFFGEHIFINNSFK